MNLNYPAELPVSAHREEILNAMRRGPVVIVSGDTGSGKTTQLPKMALEAGCGVRGRRIAITQPRRLAAVAMATRVAEELGSPVGEFVGYHHRFARKVSNKTRLTFMTDGVLLAETRGDPLLRQYDCIIVDEAHERSLNVDFLLGILKRILLRRRDLKVIVSSATLDVERFAVFFSGAPVVSVPGRLFPIEVVYRPPPEDEERDIVAEVADAVATLPPEDDILVFLPGERDIRESAEELIGRYGNANDVIPLLASLPAGEQQRAFRTSPRRRIILATNVAETSVTIPNIRAVIDSGLARISRYVHRTQVQRLQIEPISQASARQRMGRCGRLGPGTCVRLYSEEDLLSRDAYTPPEVLRSSLAGVILTMLDLGLGDIAEFPFLDPPRPTMIHEGYRELLELGALTRDQDRRPTLTKTGRILARIPVEPRLAKMLLAGAQNAVLSSVLPIVAALSCDDPRRRPIDEREKADQAHAPFRVPGSDFLGRLHLWDWWHEKTAALSQGKARTLAKKTYLSYPKMREWQGLVRQLTELCVRLKITDQTLRHPPTEAEKSGEDFATRFHRALLAGLLSHIGRYDEEEHDYRGAHALRFALHPGSVLAKKPKHPHDRNAKGPKPLIPAWVMAGELVDTTRLYARDAAVIDVAWLEPIAGELCKRSYREPTWDAERGFPRVTEQVTLYGLVIVPSRRRDLSHIDPALARAIFIHDGLLGCALPRPSPLLQKTFATIRHLKLEAEKRRKPELFKAEALAAYFDSLLPPDVASSDALRRWLRIARPQELAKFTLRESDWLDSTREDNDFPDRIRLGNVTLALSYRHVRDDPEIDGITCTLRSRDVQALRLWPSDWLVPGALGEKLMWMLSVLPNSTRRLLLPLEDTIAELLATLKPGQQSLEEAVCAAIYARWGFRIPTESWQRLTPPPHLRVRFVVLDDKSGRTLLVTRDREEVLSTFLRQAPTQTAPTKDPACTWVFGTIPEKTNAARAGWTIAHYPALKDEGCGVLLRLYPDAREAERVHTQGVARLLELALARECRLSLRRQDLTLEAACYLKDLSYETAQLAEDIFLGAVRAALVEGRAPVRDEKAFLNRTATARAEVMPVQAEMRQLVLQALAEAARLASLADRSTKLAAQTVNSINTQLAWLVFRGFPARVPYEMLKRYPRYLKGIAKRIERAGNQPSSDRTKEALLAPHWQRYAEAITGPNRGKYDITALTAYRWMVEEYRISLFAQELHTPEPISPKRLDEAWARASQPTTSSSLG